MIYHPHPLPDPCVQTSFRRPDYIPLLAHSCSISILPLCAARVAFGRSSGLPCRPSRMDLIIIVVRAKADLSHRVVFLLLVLSLPLSPFPAENIDVVTLSFRPMSGGAESEVVFVKATLLPRAPQSPPLNIEVFEACRAKRELDKELLASHPIGGSAVGCRNFSRQNEV